MTEKFIDTKTQRFSAQKRSDPYKNVLISNWSATTVTLAWAKLDTKRNPRRTSEKFAQSSATITYAPAYACVEATHPRNVPIGPYNIHTQNINTFLICHTKIRPELKFLNNAKLSKKHEYFFHYFFIFWNFQVQSVVLLFSHFSLY